MKTYSYSINSTHGKGTVVLYTRPWRISLVEWFAHWIAWEWLYKVRLPNWPQIQWNDEDKCSPREWLGDVGQAVLCFVTNPLVNWVYRHKSNKQIVIKLGYARIKELFYSDSPQFFDEHEVSDRPCQGEQEIA